MNLIKNQLLLLCIFIIFTSLITYIYIKKQNQNHENFTTSNLAAFTDSQIPNLKIKTTINSNINDFNSTLNKYSLINPFITVDSNGKLCDASTTTDLNFCETRGASSNNQPTCLVDKSLSSCSKLFSDGYINTQSNIDLNSLATGISSTIISASALLIQDINSRNTAIDTILNSILDKLDIKEKHLSIISNYADTINSKTTILKNTTDDFEKNENDVFINQYNFQNYLIQNNNNNKKIALYRNILYGLLITIIVVGIFLYFVS
jgi:hypothetical protein